MTEEAVARAHLEDRTAEDLQESAAEVEMKVRAACDQIEAMVEDRRRRDAETSEYIRSLEERNFALDRARAVAENKAKTSESLVYELQERSNSMRLSYKKLHTAYGQLLTQVNQALVADVNVNDRIDSIMAYGESSRAVGEPVTLPDERMNRFRENAFGGRPRHVSGHPANEDAFTRAAQSRFPVDPFNS